MANILTNPMFGIALSILAYLIGVYLNKKTKNPFVNPLLIAIALVIIVLQTFHIPLASYQIGGNYISLFLAPATAVLGYSIYRQVTILKKYFIPIVIGCLVGSLTSMGSVFVLCKIFGLEDVLLSSLLPKSVTTPIAMAVSSQLGGIPSITVAIVIITGIIGAVLAPLLIKIFHIDEEVAQGVAIGTCSHAVGTSKAIELGEIQGAMSGIAIGISGIITVIISLFL